jgi:hypothetical protein
MIREIYKTIKTKIFPRDISKPKNTKYAKLESKSPRKKIYGMVVRGQELSTTLDLDDSDSSDSSASTEETDKAVFLSTEFFSKAIPFSRPADLGMFSYISDQPDLFREIKHIKRRSIRVNRGVIYTDHKNIIDIIYEDRSFILLSDIFYIPGFGVNLLLTRRVY